MVKSQISRLLTHCSGYGASDYGAGSDYGSEYGAYDPYGGYGTDYDPVVLECLANDPSGGHDANAWIKTPGKPDYKFNR